MKKKWLFLIPALFVLAGCGVERLNNAISKGFDDMKSPSWDLDFDVPVGKVKAQLSKIQEVNDMLEELKFTDNADLDNGESALIHVKINELTISGEDFENIDTSVTKAIGSDSVLTWPLPVGRLNSPTINDTSIPVIKLDLDSDNVQDLMLTKLKSNDGSLKIKLKMEFGDSFGASKEATEEDYFDENGEPYIAIENISDASGDYAIQVGTGKFSFKPGVYQDGYLVFETENFLTDYEKFIEPTRAWVRDVTADDWVYEENGSHKLSETEYEYRVSIPKNVLKIRGKSFSIIENVLKKQSENNTENSNRSRSVSRSGSVLTDAEIQDKIKSANGDVTVLESLLTEDGVTLEEVADAYKGNLDEVLADSKCEIYQIMASETIASNENIKILGNEFGEYTFEGGTTLEAIENAGNLQSLADFCKFHKRNAVQSITFTFEVEVDLGEGFLITAEFIKDYEISVDTGDSLPFSKLGSILDRATLEANVKHNFMCEMKIKEPKIANSTMKISGIKEAENGFYAIPEDPCRILFNLDEMPTEDGGLDFTMLIPEDKEVDIALNPTEETDLWIEMELGANGVLKVDAEEISNIMGGE